ncbi:MAG TPA: MarR family transcriptional regulator [Amycolatopsis sp.]|uniref:MarR family winged helix-turn-helix transcriptional regulator n=1 Tax=Amycolatopsis sp. TaxID=37632 RepID=UPI002B45D440|nr:MarR family transcriptional regulator [Amycolatopsis sp.]HKS45955.1 MarR family transcriptional regulator [Amycolatopsis sp.]
MEDVCWLTEKQRQAWEAYITAAHLVEGAVAHQLRIGAALSHGDYALLHQLSVSPGKSLRMGEIAYLEAAPKSRISYQVDQLVKRGLVRREPHAEDGRGLVAVLTDEGERLLAETAPGHVATVREHFIDLLDEDQLDTLEKISSQLAERLRANRA